MPQQGVKAEQMAIGFANAYLGGDVPRPNLLVNGGFEQWQRGAGPFTVTGQYTCDRWHIQTAGTDTMSITRSTNIASVGGGQYNAQISFTLGTGAGGTLFCTRIRPGDGLEQVRGRTVTFAIDVVCSNANAIRAFVQGIGSAAVYSGFHSGSGGVERLTVTLAVPGAATDMYIGLAFSATLSPASYCDNAMLVFGSIAADYVPLTPADDVARCKRYYQETVPSNDGVAIHSGYGAAGSQHFVPMGFFSSEMAVPPTTTKVGTWSVSNASQPTLFTNNKGWAFRVTVTALGEYSCSADGITGGSKATFEANP